MDNTTLKYKSWGLRDFTSIPQADLYLSDDEKHSIQIVGNVLPFKVNNYVVDELIDWTNIPDDPIFQLTFPQKGMLTPEHFHRVEHAISHQFDKQSLLSVVNKIRADLNPHPSSQVDNIPMLDGVPLPGIQHKYKETALFFPSNSQTCHAYCTFCFRWPQFVNGETHKFGMKEVDVLIRYVEQHPEITDVLFTGGDPMIMSAKNLAAYIDPVISRRTGNLQNIRIGTKVLGYWPYKFLTDPDADDTIRLFEKIVRSGYNLSIMAHFSHPNELRTDAVRSAIKRILSTGAQIRTQSPVMKHINDSSLVWKEMWQEQVKLGCVPYYMFIARDTGAQSYFAVSLENALEIYQGAYKQVSGIARTARGPIMSAHPGKVHILGINHLNGEKVFTLAFAQARNPEWVGKVFFARYDDSVVWLDELTPAFGKENFFFEEKVSMEI